MTSECQMTDDDHGWLVDFLSDDLTAEETQALIARLKTDPALARELLLFAGDEARLVEWAKSAVPLLAKDATNDGSPTAALSRNAWRRVAVGVVSLATAAALLLAFGGGKLLGLSPDADLVAVSMDDAGESDGLLLESVARVVNESIDCDWYTENRRHTDPWSLHQGDTVRLNSGSVRIQFEHGTYVALQAPAALEVRDDMNVRVHRGSIRVVVAEGAEGFSILTPSARVIDLGTEFGVSVDDRGGTDVVVFKGSVDIEGRTNDVGPQTPTTRLIAGEALRMDELGTASRIVTVDSKRFPTGYGEGAGAKASSPVIGRVSDNIDREDNFSFYEIVHGGMHEDALAFVDRPDHQWNGVDAKGLPAYLVGGDYVRMFNDDKLSESLQIQLSLSQAAHLYILLDKRADPPAWLREGFVRKGEEIGLDEGSGRYRELGPDGSPRWVERPTGVGPGASIDQFFSIWELEIPTAKEVTLGPLSGKDWDVNMYGVVAVPRDVTPRDVTPRDVSAEASEEPSLR